uniref:uncharacterized protein LOC112434979 n=1 Tax=Maylandia zebra TaxID=106582 RepID=UPI000D31D1FF|nr:uncharacterized protein LOC112434979 [Maylandia zebra]
MGQNNSKTTDKSDKKSKLPVKPTKIKFKVSNNSSVRLPFPVTCNPRPRIGEDFHDYVSRTCGSAYVTDFVYNLRTISSMHSNLFPEPYPERLSPENRSVEMLNIICDKKSSLLKKSCRKYMIECRDVMHQMLPLWKKGPEPGVDTFTSNKTSAGSSIENKSTAGKASLACSAIQPTAPPPYEDETELIVAAAAACKQRQRFDPTSLKDSDTKPESHATGLSHLIEQDQEKQYIRREEELAEHRKREKLLKEECEELMKNNLDVYEEKLLHQAVSTIDTHMKRHDFVARGLEVAKEIPVTRTLIKTYLKEKKEKQSRNDKGPHANTRGSKQTDPKHDKASTTAEFLWVNNDKVADFFKNLKKFLLTMSRDKIDLNAVTMCKQKPDESILVFIKRFMHCWTDEACMPEYGNDQIFITTFLNNIHPECSQLLKRTARPAQVYWPKSMAVATVQ